MRASPVFTQRNFWVCVPLNLKDVAEQLRNSFGLVDPDFGSEDSEEWFEGFASGGMTFYVCRAGGIASPVRFIIKPYATDPAELGRRLASCLGQPVSYGEVTYLGDEKYSFEELSRYEEK